MMALSLWLSPFTLKSPWEVTSTPSPTRARAWVELLTRFTPPPMVRAFCPPMAEESATVTFHISLSALALTFTLPVELILLPSVTSPMEAETWSEMSARETAAPTEALGAPMLTPPAMMRVVAALSAVTLRPSPSSFLFRLRLALSPISARTLLPAKRAAKVPARFAAVWAEVFRLPDMAST